MSPGVTTPWYRGSRGEWLVVGQVLLGGLIVGGPQRLAGHSAWPFPVGRLWPLAGSVLMVGGAVLFLAGLRSLGRGLSVLPYPKDGTVLVQTGPYAWVRHPLYSGLLGLGFGWALCVQSGLTLGYAAALFVLLDLKSRREEAWLTERFPAYPEYSRRVRRLVPFLY